MTTSEAPRTVNGRTVIEDRPTPAPISGRGGKPVYWQQVRTLVLHTGETLYGCAHCDYTSSNVYSIRPHLSAHSNGKSRRNGKGKPGTSTDIGELLAQLSRLDELTQDRDEWRQRALKAERNLRAIRRAIGGDS